MAVESLASFNPSLPPASWLAEGMPLRTNPPSHPNLDYTAPPSPLKCWGAVWRGMNGCKDKVEPPDGSWYWEPEGHGFRWRTKHKLMIMVMCGYFGDQALAALFFSIYLTCLGGAKWWWCWSLGRNLPTFPLTPLLEQSFPLCTRNNKICWLDCHEIYRAHSRSPEVEPFLFWTLWVFLHCHVQRKTSTLSA